MAAKNTNMLPFVFMVLSVVTATNTSFYECEPTSSISSMNELSLIHECQVINGDLVFENFQDPMIELKTLIEVNGNLIIKGSPELTRIEAPNLQAIEGSLHLEELTRLSIISFPSLERVSALNWKVIPLLSYTKFSSDIKDIKSIVISDTSLTGFSGFLTKKLDMLDVNNNRFLEVLTSNVEEISGKLHIASNAPNLLLDLPQLTKVENISIHNLKQVDLSNLKEIQQSVSINENAFENLELPNLQKIGGTLSVSTNVNLASINMESLQEINGGLMFSNNSKIHNINFLSNLSKVDGGLELIGNFDNVTFNSLKLVKGSAKIQSKNPNFDCDKLIKDQLSLAIRGGKIDCSVSSKDYDDEVGNSRSIRKSESFGSKVYVNWVFHLIPFMWYL